MLLALYQARQDLAASAAYQGLDSRIPESRFLADWMVAASPNDPYTHLAAARYFEKTFEINDLDRGLAEYEAAAALAPNHYGIWLELGAARDRSGNSEGAEAAYQRALELAPTYASVEWAFGNLLIRHGKTEQGFDLISRAAASDPKNYADSAVSAALQFFDGDPDQVRKVLGSSSATNAALTNVLTSQRKWGPAYDAWNRIDKPERQAFKDIGNRLINMSNDALQTRIAVAVSADLYEQGLGIGAITNGGFEGGLKLRNAGPFEWQVAQGAEPQIGLSEGVKRSGRYSMSVVFNSFEASEFRSISQRIAVEPGGVYEFNGFYRTDIKSKAAFRWEIADVHDRILGSSDPLALNGDWATIRARFTVPAEVDGIVLRFIRTGCGATGACPVTGKAYFDDFSLTRY